MLQTGSAASSPSSSPPLQSLQSSPHSSRHATPHFGSDHGQAISPRDTEDRWQAHSSGARMQLLTDLLCAILMKDYHPSLQAKLRPFRVQREFWQNQHREMFQNVENTHMRRGSISRATMDEFYKMVLDGGKPPKVDTVNGKPVSWFIESATRSGWWISVRTLTDRRIERMGEETARFFDGRRPWKRRRTWVDSVDPQIGELINAVEVLGPDDPIVGRIIHSVVKEWQGRDNVCKDTDIDNIYAIRRG